MEPFQDPAVAAIFDAFPTNVRQKALEVRACIFDIAKANPKIGKIHETLKWGEPAYSTNDTKSGSTIRLNKKKGAANKLALYFICKTTLVDEFKMIFGDTFIYEGNRALILDADSELPKDAIKTCLEIALTYQLRGKSNKLESI
jgi:Domain of unknown function (DU1801)